MACMTIFTFYIYFFFRPDRTQHSLYELDRYNIQLGMILCLKLLTILFVPMLWTRFEFNRFPHECITDQDIVHLFTTFYAELPPPHSHTFLPGTNFSCSISETTLYIFTALYTRRSINVLNTQPVCLISIGVITAYISSLFSFWI